MTDNRDRICPLLEHDVEGWIRCCTNRFLPMARRIARSDATAREALQDSWIIVLEKLYQYRGGPPACGWVAAIVRHEAINGSKVRMREVPLGTEGLQADKDRASLEAHYDELRQLLLEAIDDLPPTFREVVKLRDLEDRSNAEVAAQLHISKSNVSVRLHRAHRLLRTALTTKRTGRRRPEEAERTP